MTVRYTLWPRRISTQMSAILIICMLTTLFIIACLLTIFRPYVPPVPYGPWASTMALETGFTAIESLPEAEQPVFARKISNPDLSFFVNENVPCQEKASAFSTEGLRRILQSRHADTLVSVKTCSTDDPGTTVSYVSFDRGRYIALINNRMNSYWPHVLHVAMPLIVAFSSLTLMVITLSFWSVRRINRPLSDLAERVDTFGYDISPTPLDENGPAEIQSLAMAYNRMQTRIVQHVEERTRMLMTIGHDLRTPLTRMAMRVELGESTLKADALRRDVSLMTHMLNGALSFLRGQNDEEPEETTDLDSLIESLCTAFSDTGKPVFYTPGDQVVCCCQPVALSRALNNLIENGLRYGGDVTVTLQASEQKAIISISDNGPGIPAESKEAMQLPFTRMDQARSSPAGLGLGLSIVRQIIDRHKGTMALLDNLPEGLLVQITLPVSGHSISSHRPQLTSLPHH
ncbi:ATP-binding protein [Acetobacter sp. DsW_059]|uniref:ATP-binding protein n=1 Tax=Acetobacter sp. DsW_059 TaxID=1670661 RepID=UPI000A3BA0BC|nr:ATP-binding protein [Acetobacter sp. DsW_059]OUJ10659.1 hypothetical protein HK25_06495 [Acetobacter sp. DsW_059]